MADLPTVDPIVPLGSATWNPQLLDEGLGVYPEHVCLTALQVVGADDMNRVRVGRAVYFCASANFDGTRYAVRESLDPS